MRKEDTELLPKDLPGGGKALIAWNRAQWIHGADPRRPLALEVRVAVREPGPTGMPEGRELKSLEDLERQLLRAAGRRRAEHALTITGAGERTWVWYLPARVGLLRRQDPREALTEALRRIERGADRELAISWKEDPEWSRLLGIFPAHDPEQWALDNAMMVHMAQQRDAIHARRQVFHRVFFTAHDACPAFLREIRRLKLKSQGGPKEQPDGRWLVTLARIEPTVAVWHLHPVVLQIKAVAQAHGGSYDGWETDLVPSKVPPPLVPPRGG